MFATSTAGQYYEVTEMTYSQAENKTYSIWSRYDVVSKYDTHKYHFHVEISNGKSTVDELVSLAQSRSDAGIKAISGVK